MKLNAVKMDCINTSECSDDSKTATKIIKAALIMAFDYCLSASGKLADGDLGFNLPQRNNKLFHFTS
jgi:hypothetical protein